MIGKPEWFTRRKFGGWGLHPKNLKGWFYVLFFMVVLIVFQAIPFWDTMTRLVFTGIWGLVLIFDTIDIMVRMKKDERETMHEAISERNAMWAISIILAIGVAYQIAVSAINQKMIVDWWIVLALIVGVAVKSISNYYLDKKN